MNTDYEKIHFNGNKNQAIQVNAKNNILANGNQAIDGQ
jgi:hypothetical protein